MTTPKKLPELHKGLTRLSASKRQGRGATVVRLARNGMLRKLRPGVYRPADREAWMHQDLLDACAAVPGGVICLVSALAYYGLTTTVPNAVWMAIPRNAWAPMLTFPARFVRMGDRSMDTGVETLRLAGQRVRIFGKAKTVCDLLGQTPTLDESHTISRTPIGSPRRSAPGTFPGRGGCVLSGNRVRGATLSLLPWKRWKRIAAWR